LIPVSDSHPEPGDRLVVSCPDCQEKHTVSASRVPPQGGRLTCRICGGRIVLLGRRTTKGVPIVVRPPDAPSQDSEAVSASGVADPSRTEVQCPHCRKSFTPGASATAAKAGPPPPSLRREPTPVVATSAVTTPARSGRKTILVAEDTEFFLELVTEILGSHYRMLGARTKAEALGLLGRESIDLLILDLSLESPEDGLEVLARVAPRGLPCLIFTAGNEVDLWGEGWARLQAQGASDLLLKGMNIEEQLLSKVAALLGP
jgi:CheY-like chemotaxis protein